MDREVLREELLGILNNVTGGSPTDEGGDSLSYVISALGSKSRNGEI